jgi:thiol-disulfide isomerase/thioredoxin
VGRSLGEDQAVRTLFGVGLVFVCLGLAGCSVFGKKNSNADASSRNGSSGGPVARTAVPSDSNGPAPGANGLLAGQVQDVDNRRRAGVLIQVVDLQDAKGAAAKIEVEADKDGYFTIQGLQAGHHYQLIARVKDGEHLLSGSAVVMPPNPRMSIVMSEDFTSSTTPPLPKTPPLPERNKGTKQGGPAATILPPRVDDDPTPRPSPESNINVKDPSKIATDDAGERWPKSPPVDMRYVPPPPPSSPARNRDEDPLLPKVGPGADGRSRDPSPGVVQTGLTPAPSCVLVGNKLDNFALYDLDGQAWEFKRDRRGRLTLLEFGHSTCGPCLSLIPVLVQWQKTYRTAGLEIVGISYEPGSREQQVANVRATRGRYSINYTTLLGGQERCPVEQQFKVDVHPTLVLLDETGQIVWRGSGYDPVKLTELEFEIRKRLERRR